MLLLALFFAGVMVFQSCREEKQEFEFQLEVVGEVQDSVAPIEATFQGVVTNLETLSSFELLNAPEVMPIERDVGASEWLDQIIESKFISIVSESAAYTIFVKGRIYDTRNGLTLSVDKDYTNLPVCN